ncbi:MAG: Flp/Fap pilin component [Pseudomonadota bacterium]|jgi:pilus assembly protein Flp/PilA
MKVIAAVQRFLNDEEGASGIEYAMIAGMVAVVLAASSGSIRTSVSTIFETVATKLSEAAAVK